MKKRIFAFFMEPSSYTIDLIHHVHKKCGIDYSFIYDSSLAKTKKENRAIYLSRMPFFKRVLFVFHVFRNNKMIIFNGYNRWEFLALFILNWVAPKKRFLAIESDTQFKILRGWKAIVKKKYLSLIFSNSYVLGFSGGSVTHKQLFRHYGMSEDRIFLMPMMVDNKRFYRKKKKASSMFTFLYVGRLIPHKNINLLIESFINCFSDNNDVLLKIVGIGELLESFRYRYGHIGNISFEGSRYDQDLVIEYHNSDVLILPSLEEPWGLVVNEALSAGLAIIASDKVGAIYDLVEGKETGCIFKADDSLDLSEKMLKLYQDRELCNYYSHNAEILMKNHWNYDLYKKSILEAIAYSDKNYS